MTGPDALGTAENESGSAKHENEPLRPRKRRKRVRDRKTIKWDPMPSLPPKMSTGTQNMKMGLDALGSTENEFGSAKYENGTRCRRYRPK
jgi:hypothetical protein